MTTEEAIGILNKQKNKLNNCSLITYENWIVQSTDYLKAIFGPNSASFTFFIINLELPNNLYKVTTETEFHELKIKATCYLENCIEILQNVGVYKEPRSNFLRSVSTEIILACIIFLIPIIFYAGDYFRSFKIDQEKFNLKEENQNLKKQNQSLKTNIDTIINRKK